MSSLTCAHLSDPAPDLPDFLGGGAVAVIHNGTPLNHRFDHILVKGHPANNLDALVPAVVLHSGGASRVEVVLVDDDLHFNIEVLAELNNAAHVMKG